MIYLDSAATSLRRPEEVIEAVCEAMRVMGNPGRGAYEASLQAARTVYQARREVGRLFGMKDPSRVVFTANVTEALNLAIGSLFGAGSHVITTCMEHNSVLRPLYRQESRGASLTVLPCDEMGRLRYELLEQVVRPETKGIVCTHASNLTGNLNDIRKIGSFCRERGLLFVLDAAQTAGIFPIHMEQDQIDVLCFTGHKGLMGPQGTGGICVDPQVKIPPFKTGGSGILSFDREHPDCMPEALEAGTLNIHGLAGLGAAFDYLRETGLEKIIEHEKRLAKLFYEEVKDIEGLKVYGDFSTGERTPAVSLNVAGYDSKEAGEILAGGYQIATRAGVHCAPLIHEALGTRERGTLRFSFSWFNTEEEIYKAALAVREIGQEWKYEE